MDKIQTYEYNLEKMESSLMISVWLRVIRVRFLLASIIAVSVGLALHWSQNGSLDYFDVILTFAGVLALHASVDLLNDYWDFKRGIDTKTTRTKMSGGTGVLPEGLLKPSSVYRAGVVVCASYIATGLVIFGAVSGEIGGIVTTLVFWVLGQVALVLAGLVYEWITPYSIHDEIEKDNVAAGVAFAGALVGIGVIVFHASAGNFISWAVNYRILRLR